MSKTLAVTELRERNFYFLYLRELAETGMTNYKWHEHSFYELLLLSEGEYEYVIENRRYVMKKGDVLLIKPGTHHFGRRVIKSPISLYCIGFSPEHMECGRLAEGIFNKGEHFSLPDDSPIQKILCAAKCKLDISRNNASQFIKSVCESTLLILDDVDMKITHEERTNESVQKIIDYVNKNLASISTLEDISTAIFFSSSYVRCVFKKEMGIGIMQYVRNKKVLLAERLIKSGRKPTDIYTECGFSNYTSFYRAYSAYYGASPKQRRTASKIFFKK